jgi:Tfp pilus assembly protein PilO
VTDVNTTNWRVSRTVSLESVLMVLIWAGTAVWYISTGSERLSQIEKEQDRNRAVIERLSAVETETKNLKETIGDLKTVINRIDRKLPTFKELQQQDEDRP